MKISDVITYSLAIIGASVMSATAWAEPAPQNHYIDCTATPYDQTLDEDKRNIAAAFCALVEEPVVINDYDLWGKYRLLGLLQKAFKKPEYTCDAYTVERRGETREKTAYIDRMETIAAEEKAYNWWWPVNKVANPIAVDTIADLKSNVCVVPEPCPCTNFQFHPIENSFGHGVEACPEGSPTPYQRLNASIEFTEGTSHFNGWDLVMTSDCNSAPTYVCHHSSRGFNFDPETGIGSSYGSSTTVPLTPGQAVTCRNEMNQLLDSHGVDPDVRF